MLSRYAWYQANAHDRAWPAGQLKSNDLGLFDALGNAWEWCQEKWPGKGDGAKPPAHEDAEDLEPVSERMLRVTRGGSFALPASAVRAASRNEKRPIDLDDAIGFRIARTSP